jgi:hypothetical protein
MTFFRLLRIISAVIFVGSYIIPSRPFSEYLVISPDLLGRDRAVSCLSSFGGISVRFAHLKGLAQVDKINDRGVEQR